MLISLFQLNSTAVRCPRIQPFRWQRLYLALVLLFLGVGTVKQVNAQFIRTVAGSSTYGDGGPATFASLNEPAGVAVDASGNLYISDKIHERIRKVAPDGTITTVAGTGVSGYTGDGGMAINAMLTDPFGVVVDGSGNLYFVDNSHSRVRKVTPSGIISTVAGTGNQNYSGDGGPATSADLYFPLGVGVDASGNLYIADQFNNCIRKVDTNGIITTVAGNGTAGYSGDGGPATSAKLNLPAAVTVDASGNLYISDTFNHCVRKVTTNGTITTVAGTGISGANGDNGPATSARIASPTGVAVDASGNFYIVSQTANRIRKVDTNGTITTPVGTGTGFSGDGGAATAARLTSPRGVALDGNGNLYIADERNNRIRKVDTNGIITTVAGSSFGDGGPPTNAQLSNPEGVAVDASGNIYIADQRDHRIRKVTPNGAISTVAGRNNGNTGFDGDGTPAINAALNSPYGIALDGSGAIYFSDQGNYRIRKVSTAGIITTVAGNGAPSYSGDNGPATSAALSYSACGVAVDGNGNLYIADRGNHRIRKVSSLSIITTVAGNGSPGFSGDGGTAISAQLNFPTGVAVDASGNLYIADQNNHRIRKVDAVGTITTIIGTGTAGYMGDGGLATNATLNGPNGVAIDGIGNLFISDQLNHSIRMVTATGIISTTVGNGTSGFSGDGGLATSAQLFNPFGLAVDGNANIYVADFTNNRVRKLNGPVSVSVSPANPTAVCSGSSFSLSAIATNFLPSSFTWTSQPSSLSANVAISTFTAPSVNSPMTYTLTVIASDGLLSATTSVTLTVNPLPSASLSASGTLTCAQTSITLTAGGGTSYSLSNGQINSTGQFVMVASGLYSVTVATANGCTSTTTTTVFSNTTVPTASLASNGTLTCAQTSVTLTASGGTSYSLSNGQSNPTGQFVVSTSGLYSVTVASANGCTSTTTTTVFSNTTVPTASLASNGTLTCSQTSVTLTTGTGTSYSLSNGQTNSTGQFVVSASGLYSVTVATANGCISTITTTISSNTTAPTASLIASGTLTCAQTSITLTAGGGNSYSLSNGQSNSTGQFVVSASGLYSVTVASVNSCTSTTTTTVFSTSAPTVTITANPGLVISQGQTTTLTASGASTYLWSTGATTSIIVVSNSGSYSVIGAIGNCSAQAMVTIITSIVSVQNGDWSSMSTWNCSCVPTSSDTVTISTGHIVSVSQSVQARSLQQNGKLLFSNSGKISF